MKHLIPIILLSLSAAFGNAQAATIYDIQSDVSIYADEVVDKTGAYYDQTFTGFDSSSPATLNELSTNLSGSDLTKYAWTPNAHLPSDKLPGVNPVGNSYIDLSFAQNVYNNEGADLVLFFAGNGTNLTTGTYPYQFSVDVGADGTIDVADLGVTSSTTSDISDYKFYASYAIIDLDDYGSAKYENLGDIRLHLGDTSMPALAAVGAYHVTAVPLPLPIILFASGLTLLGWVGRRKHS